MTSQMNVKVRLVRCPRCSKLLPEMAEVPVYECGGCGTVLKAKTRKNDTKDMEPHLHKLDPTQESDSKDQGTDGLNQQTVPSSNESAVDKSNEQRERDDSVDHNVEQINGFNHSNELHSSTAHENPGLSTVARSETEANEDNRVDQNERRDEDDFGDKNFSGLASPSTEPTELVEASSLAEPGGASLSTELGEASPSAEPGEASPSAEPGEASPSTEPGEASPSVESSEASSSTEPGEASPSTEPSRHVNESSSPFLAGACMEVNESKSLEQNDEGDRSEFGDDTEADENLKSRPISKSSSEESFLDSGRMHSFATARRSFADSILSGNLGSPPKDQMNQGQNSLFRALERVSSTDTLENLLRVSTNLDPSVMLNNISKSPTTKSYYAYYGSESSCNENEYRVHSRHFHAPKRNFKDKGLVSPNGLAQSDKFTMKHYPTKGNKWHQDEFLEPTRHVPRVPLYPRGSQAAGPSTYGHNKFEYNSMYERERPESSKVELLKMVCELQDQLDRKYSSIEEANGKYPLRYGQGQNWSQPFPANRMAFSGEAGHFRHHVDCSCLRCLPQERRYSGQLPRHVANQGYYMTHQSPNYYNSHYGSGPSSPIHYTGSEFSSWSRDNNQWHKDRELKKLNLSEKHQPVKRHCRPVAGGSPIIVCYKCSALLQLPADFLVFKRRFHLLRCSACSKVLKFSVRDRVHLVRYLPDSAMAPPPSEIDEYNTDSIIKRRNFALASASRVSEPISSSVDYGRSSTEGERSSSLVPPFHTHERNSGDRKMSSVSSFEPVEERKNKSILNGLKNESKNQNSESRKTGKTGSPLHRLMGYASPSKVWRVDFNGL